MSPLSLLQRDDINTARKIDELALSGHRRADIAAIKLERREMLKQVLEAHMMMMARCRHFGRR